MKGFFTAEDVGPADLCDKCGLYKTCKSPRMEYSGEGKKKVLIIAEAPGATEDQHGKQLIGEAGELLRDCLDELGYHLDLDFWKINACNCRPPKNRKPTRKELKCCKPRVDDVISKLKPNFIFLMGGAAVESFYMDTFSDLSITRWRKRCIPDPTVKAWVIPLYHPSFVLRNQDKKLEMVFKNDLKWALSCLRRDKPTFVNYENYVTKLDEDNVIKVLQKNDWWQVAFDYETNGLNPWKEKDPQVFSVSISPADHYAYSFKMTDKIKPYWIEFLKDERIQKVAHNLKFEEKWSRVVFGTPVKGWVWDTMTSQHVLDNRKKVTGLKFQAYVRYGAKGYDKEVKIYIKGLHGGMSKEATDKVLTYGGMDALFTHKLYTDQVKEFSRNKDLQRANKLFFDGVLALADVEGNGVCVDFNYYKKEDKRLETELEKVKETLNKTNEVISYKNVRNKDLDLKSPTEIGKLLYDIMGLPRDKKTTKDNDSVDHSVLEKLCTPFGNNLLKYRKLLKIKDTYLSQFLHEYCVDGKIHSSFDLNFVTSYRSSSSNPNLQNVPVRDDEGKKVTRRGVLPRKGNKILEVDYGSLEVRIMACYTKDPVLLNYLISGGDMHKDEALETFLLSPNEWDSLDKVQAKELRFYTKNQKVFPYFYGSYFKACGSAIWALVDKLGIKKHLYGKGIRSYYDFLNHLEIDERRFWNKFNVFRKWQENIENEYFKRGKISYYTGFKVDGYLTKNQLLNWAVQGTAFHCLLWSLIELNKELKNYKSKIIGQIHDSIIFDLDPAEENEIVELSNYIMTEKIRQEWEWIIVPLIAEYEITEIDQAWYYKKERK